MSFVLSDLREGIKSKTVYIGGQPINLKINPSAVTQTKLDDYRDASQDQDYDAMSAIFGEIVVEWDITETDGGEPLPINADMYEIVPSLVTVRIWDEINNLILPKSRKKNER